MKKAPGLTSLRAIRDRRGSSRAEQMMQRELAARREHPDRAHERLGKTDQARPKGPLVWFHTPDEVAALDVLQLIERMRLERDNLNFLITTSKYDATAPLSARLPSGCTHQFLPYDEGPGMGLFLEHWRPDICIWADQVLRAATIDATAARGVALFMLNATMPDEKHQKLRWFPGTIRKVLGQFERVLAIDARSGRNLKQLGLATEKIEVAGVLHEGAPPLDCAQDERDALAGLLAARPVWLAAGITKAEEAAILGAHRIVSRRSHRLLLILVPDDKERAAGLAQRLERDNWIVALRSAGQEPELETQIYIADVAGEMGLWFRLSPLSFIGQTLDETPGAGRDPYQATALGSAVLHGPQHGAYAKSYARLHAAGAARQVKDEKALSHALEYLLAPDKVAEMARAAWEVSTSGADVTNRISALVFDALDAGGV